ncbi:phosphoribosylanthranilate isomerase [Gluconobacter morbifer]|uniref:N-(5'-phosphoribosyl)anthranilate isomerase n=1 Tax=Gluconobacter morbifer G707 TaxID=1088869 RepID=G6XIT7_9PROT|nr:phosphoribosylanthranilate isomerase [Gluconobacter morbifer]EHH68263.1 N-(5'-phosphoribosyl)anthranilate isomerase [Gluconobacter morbifer G707]
MTGIKICGIRDRETMVLCADLKVDWVGFVFHPASPRFLTIDQASELDRSVPAASEKGPERAGLFVGASDDTIARTLAAVQLNVLQIYDTAERAAEIREKFGRPVWLAKGIKTAEDLPQYAVTDGYVIESPRTATDTRPGGLGRTFEWSLTAGWKAPCFWMLAGGLTPANVKNALRIAHPPAVDVSSGVEKERGHKSPLLIKNFVENIRQGVDLKSPLP